MKKLSIKDQRRYDAATSATQREAILSGFAPYEYLIELAIARQKEQVAYEAEIADDIASADAYAARLSAFGYVYQPLPTNSTVYESIGIYQGSRFVAQILRLDGRTYRFEDRAGSRRELGRSDLAAALHARFGLDLPAMVR